MYYNPVEVIETNHWVKTVFNKLTVHGVKNPLIISSPEVLELQKIDSVFNRNKIYCNVGSNPTFESCRYAIDFSKKEKFDGVIAIGGGSVMDTAKVVMASMGSGIVDIRKLLNVTSPYEHRVPGIFIPTTHGTGSEVTMWGTIWDSVNKLKFSISNKDLYPDVAILDANLTLSLPVLTSIISILDSLSHSFESIWNRNANIISTEIALKSVRLIFDNITNFKKNPDNIQIRSILLKASNLSGLAFSNTKTAAAHAISYPLTLYFGIPHGIAASMPLIPLLKINFRNATLNLVLKDLNLNNLDELANTIFEIPNNIISLKLKDWGISKSDIEKLIIPNCYHKGRMENNIIRLTNNDLSNILYEMYE